MIAVTWMDHLDLTFAKAQTRSPIVILRLWLCPVIFEAKQNGFLLPVPRHWHS